METCHVCAFVHEDTRCPSCGTRAGSQIAARRGEPSGVEGVVLRSEGPFPQRSRRSLGIWMAIGVFLAPFLVALAVLRFALRIALPPGASATRHGGFRELLFWHFVGRILSPEPTATYLHVIGTAEGRRVLVRQEGELRVGRLIVGDEVRVAGPRRAGEVVLRGGENRSLGVALVPESSLGAQARSVLVVAFVALAALALVAAALGA